MEKKNKYPIECLHLLRWDAYNETNPIHYIEYVKSIGGELLYYESVPISDLILLLFYYNGNLPLPKYTSSYYPNGSHTWSSTEFIKYRFKEYIKD